MVEIASTLIHGVPSCGAGPAHRVVRSFRSLGMSRANASPAGPTLWRAAPLQKSCPTPIERS